MTLRKHLAVAAGATILFSSGLTGAFAQAFTVTSNPVGAPSFTYSYLLTPATGSSLGLIVFNFADSNVTANAAPAGFTALASPGAGIFQFLSPAGVTAATTFSFFSTDGPGGSLGTTNISTAPNSSGIALGTPTNGVVIAPAAAPEPGSLASMAVLGTCLGMGIVARKRKMLAAE